MESKTAQFFELFNELIAFILIYVLMTMSDASLDLKVRNHWYASAFIALIWLYFVINISRLALDNAYKVKMLLRRHFSVCLETKSIEQKQSEKALTVKRRNLYFKLSDELAGARQAIQRGSKKVSRAKINLRF